MRKLKTLRYYLLVTLTIIFVLPATQAQQQNPFRYYDSLTYSLYLREDWNQLAAVGEEALKHGLDYFYMRMRLGIAYFSLEHYRKAIPHLSMALRLNDADTNAIYLLQRSYQYSGLETEATYLNRKRINISKTAPIAKIHLYSGFGLSGYRSITERIDLDGPQNIYGETISSGNYLSCHVGVDYHPVKFLQWYGGYTFFQIDKHQKVRINNIDTLHENYPLVQHQFSLRFPLKISGDFRLIPFGDLIVIHEQYNQVFFDKISDQYYFSTIRNIITQQSTGMEFYLEYPEWSFGYLISYSGFNSARQWQHTVSVMHYPQANLNSYAGAQYSVLNENSRYFQNLRLLSGGKIMPQVWAEGSVHFGHLKNTRLPGSTIIYNTLGNITVNSGLLMYLLVNRSLTLLAGIQVFEREESFYRFTQPEEYQIKNYRHFTLGFSGGVKWKL